MTSDAAGRQGKKCYVHDEEVLSVMCYVEKRQWSVVSDEEGEKTVDSAPLV